VTDRICAAVARTSVDEAIEAAKQGALQADVIEIRLDYLQEIAVSPFLAAVSRPLLFTNRPVWEGGRFAADEDARIVPLIEAVEQKAGFVDLELRSPAASLTRLQRHFGQSPTQLILSWHDFQRTPPWDELAATLHAMQDQGAHIGKIVTMAADFHDVLRVLRIQEEASRMQFPLIAFCMGRPGVISRLATLELGGFMTYCSAEEGRETAPGQLSAGALREMLAAMRR
jgi:3-dehydroquinate dehydratase-1